MDELNSVTRIRQQAYGRHLPQFAQSLASPELADFETDTVVLLATAKLDNAPLATMRIHTNRNKPLPLEQAVTLPDAMHSDALAEAVRFSVVNDRSGGGVIRNALFKAFYLICVADNIDWMVICARNPLHKLYLKLLFKDIFPNGCPVILPYAHNIPHRVLKLRVSEVKPLWYETNHPLFNFFFNTYHPDLEDIFSS